MRSPLASASLATILLLAAPACAQQPAAPRSAPYPCDGCEIVHDAPDGLGPAVTMAPDDEPGEHLVLTGQVLQPDGRTPASGIVLYLHQTDAAGLYRREGGVLVLQGWLETDADGRYRIETIRPGPYPSGGMPAHVHVYVGEPGREPYYLNDFVFEGDPNLTSAYMGGLIDGPDDGVVRLVRTESGGWHGERDLVLAP